MSYLTILIDVYDANIAGEPRKTERIKTYKFNYKRKNLQKSNFHQCPRTLVHHMSQHWQEHLDKKFPRLRNLSHNKRRYIQP